MQKNITASPLRYNLEQKMDRASRQKALSIRRAIIKKFAIHPSTYHRWLTIRQNESRDIPAIVLLEFAIALDVPMETLFNTQTEVPCSEQQ